VAAWLAVILWLIGITVQSAWINKNSLLYLTSSVYCDQRARVSKAQKCRLTRTCSWCHWWPNRRRSNTRNDYFKVQVNFSLRFIRHRVMKAYEGVEVKLHAFAYPALDRD